MRGRIPGRRSCVLIVGQVAEVGLGAAREYIDASQCESAGDFAKKSNFLVVGLDKREANEGTVDLDGQAREARAGADVDQVDGHTVSGGHVFIAPKSGRFTRADIRLRRGIRRWACLEASRKRRAERRIWAGKEAAGGEEGLAEMSCHDIFRFAHRGQIDAGIPSKQQVEVNGNLVELSRGQYGRFLVVLRGVVQERREEGGDAGGDHVGKFVI